MKTSLIAIISLVAPLCLSAQEPNPPPKPSEIKTEVREFRTDELQDVQLDVSNGNLSFTVSKTTYTFAPNHDSAPSQLAMSATFLAELRHAAKVSVWVQLPVGDHVYPRSFILKYDTLK